MAARAGERRDPTLSGVLADDVGSAQERRRLRHRAQQEAITRRVRTLVGVGLIAIGALLLLAAAFTLAARALPLTLLPGRPGTCSGTVLIAAGLLIATARRRRRAL